MIAYDEIELTFISDRVQTRRTMTYVEEEPLGDICYIYAYPHTRCVKRSHHYLEGATVSQLRLGKGELDFYLVGKNLAEPS